MATKKATGAAPKGATKTAAKSSAKAASKASAKSASKKAVSATASKAKAAPTQDEIARLAHQYWVEGGRQHGSHHADWKRAEEALKD